mgnify:CR=1 FL=1
MSSIVEKILDVPAEHESNVFGQFDSYAKKIERALRVTLIPRGDTVKILGDAQQAEKAKSVLLQLTELARRGNEIREQNVEKIVLGLPKHMNNDMGERAEYALAFGEMLRRRTGLPVVMWDERLTTVEAERTLKEREIRREDRKKYVDQIAAVLILQGYLDSRCGGESLS